MAQGDVMLWEVCLPLRMINEEGLWGMCCDERGWCAIL